MNCPRCGAALPADAVYCHKCGAVLNAAADKTMLADAPYVPTQNHQQPNNQKKPDNYRKLIIALIAFALVIALSAGSLIVFLSVRNRELTSAKENFDPPAEVTEIDVLQDDPSNEVIQFTYDEKERIRSCTYQANGKTYEQTYTYDDNAKKVKIVTAFRNRTVCVKEIEYQRVTKPDLILSIDGYYLRLDEKSLEGFFSTESSSTAPTATPTEAATEAPTEAPTDAPTEAKEEELITVKAGDTLTLTGTISLEEDYVNEYNNHTVMILNLEKPFDCYLYGEGTNYDGTKKYTITSVQLSDASSNFTAQSGDFLTVTGKVGLAHTAHHLRDIYLIECVRE